MAAYWWLGACLILLLGVLVSRNQTRTNTFIGWPTEELVGDVRIVHISDTHNLHDQITRDLAELKADMLIHTGDFSAAGTLDEFADFNCWLAEISPYFPRGVYLVLGNHDYKFLNGLSPDEELVKVMASDEERKKYIQTKLSNAVVLDNEALKVPVGVRGELTLTLYGAPWNPFQSSPTYPDRVRNDSRVKNDHDRVFLKWSENIPEERKQKWVAGQAWRYDEIPTNGSIDILLTHVPPFGVFDKQPIFGNWGSSSPLLTALQNSKPRMHLFGHVHAQRGYWEKTETENPVATKDSKDPRARETKIIGGVQYASTTHEEVKEGLMKGGADEGIQFLANTAVMSDRTVQPFAKKKIVGKPRLICGTWKAPREGGKGRWYFQGAGGNSNS
jgi:Icc-related predicted phosphoesterase